MDPDNVLFNLKAIKPLQCYREGWGLIKGQYWMMFAVYFVGMFMGSVAPFGVLMGPMMCGLYLCLLRKSEGKELSFSTLFEGFHYFVDGLIAGLMMMVPMFVLLLPAYLLSFALMFLVMPKLGENSSPSSFIPKLILAESPVILGVLVVGVAIAIIFSFAFALIVDKKLKAIDAVKLSARAAVNNLGGLLLLVLLNLLLGIIGLMLCYVGALFVAPITFAAKYVAYRQVFCEGLTKPSGV